MILGQAQFGRASDLFELISIYRDAIELGHAGAIEAAREALVQNTSALNYLQANDPDLFATLQEVVPSKGVVLVGGAQSVPYDIGQQARDYPASSRRTNQDVARQEPVQNRTDNRTVATSLPNQNRPSNLQKMNQQLRQYESQLRAQAEEGAIILTVSGVGDREREALAQILETEIGGVESVRESGYSAGLVEYRVRLNRITAEDLAYSLDNRRFGSFELDLMRFRPEQIDFVLKF